MFFSEVDMAYSFVSHKGSTPGFKFLHCHHCEACIIKGLLNLLNTSLCFTLPIYKMKKTTVSTSLTGHEDTCKVLGTGKLPIDSGLKVVQGSDFS